MLKRIMIVIAVILVLCVAGFFIYTQDYYHATQPLATVIAADTAVTVQQGDNTITFLPKTKPVSAGFIFYPGGKVEDTAYAQLMLLLAKKGFACVLVKMPFNLAVFDINAADRVMANNPNIKTWIIGGHSLGGSMACAYAAGNAAKLKGIVLLAAYTANDLSKTSLRALSIIGTSDGVVKRDTFDKSIPLMPNDTKYFEISGGNHGQFGDYGPQAGDNAAAISRQEQQSITVNAIADYFKESR
ncbi:MAG: alpha/beta hydrolase [Clostridia bacterium]